MRGTKMCSCLVVCTAFTCMFVCLAAAAQAPSTKDAATMDIDLSQAILITPATLSPQEQKAVDLLLDEVERRTGVRWPETHEWPAHPATVVAVGPKASLEAYAGPWAGMLKGDSAEGKAEGYRVRSFKSDGGPFGVAVAGNDARGVLFGVGRLLRELRMESGSVAIRSDMDISTAPACLLRGHQLGYRPKTNSYDAWTPEMWEQYIRDLAVFGTNAIELMPPRTDDAADSPHFPLPQIDMMKRMSQICADYGIDVWIWYPAMDEDYSNPATVEKALKEWNDVFVQLPRIDAIFVPGGDPGHTQPKFMLGLLEKETEVLHKSHPKAQMWMSPQGFSAEWTDEFVNIMQTTQPAWLSGVVFGPQVRMPLPELRKALPPQYAIRHYPDITHTVQCQFPVPNWSHAFAITEQREPINPRPTQYAHIFRMFNEYTIGFLTYSEGCNDDVNKIVWSGLGWDPDAQVVDILKHYARYFIGASYEDPFAQGILALEHNWQTPLLTNHSIMTTWAQFREMEKSASPKLKLNWRFQQALYRAYYDAYDYRRLTYESQLEQQAMDCLRQAPTLGARRAIDEAERILDRAVLEPVAQDLRARVFELAEALFQSIRMQLSVPRYQAIHVGRGANLDLIDVPLNNRLWFEKQFAEIRAMNSDNEMLKAIDGIVNWTDPGPGGFYDDLGSLTQQPHLVQSDAYYPDPEFRSEPIMAFEDVPGFRTSWCYYAETRYESPLMLKYEGLDPSVTYKVRVVYSGDSMERKIRMAADDIEVHPFIDKPNPPTRLEFEIPRSATADGTLTLAWNQEPGRGRNGRGCQVAEVWLVRADDTKGK